MTSLTVRVFFLLVTLATALSSVGLARTYEFPAVDTTSNDSAFSDGNCAVNGFVIDCPNNLILGNNDVFVITDNSNPTELNIGGDWTFGNGLEVNVDGDPSDFHISVDGNLNPGNSSIINANLTIQGSLNSGNNGSLDGGLTVGGNLNLGNNSSLEGMVTVDGDANIGNNVTIDGDLSGNNINIGENTEVNGNVEGDNVTLDSNSTINGSVNASDTVNNNGGTITGYVNADTINDNGGEVQGDTCDQNENVGPCAGLNEDEDTSSGLSTYTVPIGVNSLTIELWGAGGSGDIPDATSTTSTEGGGGGGGGAFVRRHISVTPGEVFEYYLGSGDGSGSRDSWLRRQGQTSNIILAAGGQPANGQTGGQGGQTDQSLGADKLGGGAGADGTTDGGGGGSSAGNAASGDDGDGTSGGAAPTNGGAGGDGATESVAAMHGGSPGGGGGGGLQCNDATGCTNAQPGDGANGKVRFLYGEATTSGDLDHIDLSFNTTGLTCEATPVTVRACVDGSCSAVITDTVTLDLTSTSGTWGGGASQSFAESTTADFIQTTPTDGSPVTLGATNIQPAPDGTPTVTCNGGNDCELSVVETALLLTDENGDRLNPRDTTAGTTESGYYLSAVREEDETGACEAAIENASQPVAFNATIDQLNNLVSSDPVEVNQTGIPTTLNTAPGTTQTLNLAFNADGRTTDDIDLFWDDVGRVTLNASTDVTLPGSTATDTLSLINGGGFIVGPHSLGLSGIQCDDGTSLGTGASTTIAASELDSFCRAGEDFSVTVAGTSATGNPLENLGEEVSSDDFSLGYSLVAPDPGDSGNLTHIPVPTTTSPDSTLTWSEVGVIDLEASLNSYLGASSSATGEARIGRFTPDRFHVSWSNSPPVIDPAQSLDSTGITYQGQTFDWGTPNTLTITAQNTDGATTGNYTGDFESLSGAVGLGTGTDITLSNDSSGGGSLTLAASPPDAQITSNNDGTLTLTLPADLTMAIGKTDDPTTDVTEYLQSLAVTLDLDAAVFTDDDGVFWPDGSGTAQGLNESIGDGYLAYSRLRLDSGQGRADGTIAMPAHIDVWCEPSESDAIAPTSADWNDWLTRCGEQSDAGFLPWSLDPVYPHLSDLNDIPGVSSLDELFNATEGEITDGTNTVAYSPVLGWTFGDEETESPAKLTLTLNFTGSPSVEEQLSYRGSVPVFGTCDFPVYLSTPWSSSSTNWSSPPDAQVVFYQDNCGSDLQDGDDYLIGPATLAQFGTYTGRAPVLFTLPQGR